ncbi:MAG: Na+/H+ antiporter [Ferruginibacter sp.]|nr:Na+/H+ antiporter [Ferruginibacter sp.]
MVNTFILYLCLVIVILLLVMFAKWLRIAYPIVLVLGGLVLSIIPGLPAVSINPELIFIIFLPPLLYEAAWNTSWKDFWRFRRVIASFAFLIVIITSLVVAVVSDLLIPGFTLALGFLLGGIISPPDAVSATSILKQVKVPKGITSLLEGESLLNDASSLIVFRFSLIAVGTGRFIFYEAAASFVWVIAMGIVTGIAIALLYYALHKWLPTDANIDIILTLTAPYVMYLAAERLHFSGVLAVVSGGLFLSARSHRFLSNSSRLRGENVWSALGFVLNGLVFMLIGLALPVIVGQLGTVSLMEAIGYGMLISGALIITRILCALGASAFTVFISHYITTADSHPGWRGPLVIGWAGMRGVVSLAAALSVPIYLDNGVPFPQRNLVLFITFTVILVTLVLQGLTLPLVIRWVKMEVPDKHLADNEQDLRVRRKLAEHSLQFLNQQDEKVLNSSRPLQELKARFEKEQSLPGMADNTLHEDFRKIYLDVLMKQRLVLDELNKDPETDQSIIRKYHSLLDLEEEKLRMKYYNGN